MSRALRSEVFEDLYRGNLSNLLRMVHEDTTLNMELRGNGVAIYYRGGKLFETAKDNNGNYRIKYNSAYWHTYGDYDKKHENLVESMTVEECIENKAFYKDQIDYHIAKVNDPSAEAQAQQLVVLENNVWGKKGEKSGDYYILDTEYVFSGKSVSGKFDAIALRWPTYKRRTHTNLGLSIIEMKYGDDALSGEAGIEKHIKDFIGFVHDDGCRKMCRDMERVFAQKCMLGLIPRYTEHYINDISYDITIDNTSVDMVFMLANRNPMGSKVFRELCNVVTGLSDDDKKKIYMASSSDVGYALLRYADKKAEEDRYIPLCKYIE